NHGRALGAGSRVGVWGLYKGMNPRAQGSLAGDRGPRGALQSSLMFRRLMTGAQSSAVLRMMVAAVSGLMAPGSKPMSAKRCLSAGSPTILLSPVLSAATACLD